MGYYPRRHLAQIRVLVLLGARGVGGFDLGGFRLDQFHDVIEHRFALDMMVGHAREVDHVLAGAPAGDADIGLARFAGAIDHAAE